MSEHRNTEAGYCETWADPRFKDVERIQWPDHGWAGDDDGHNCTGCTEDSAWRCDRVAHNLGQVAREQEHHHHWTIDQDKRIGTCQLCGFTAPWRPNG